MACNTRVGAWVKRISTCRIPRPPRHETNLNVVVVRWNYEWSSAVTVARIDAADAIYTHAVNHKRASVLIGWELNHRSFRCFARTIPGALHLSERA